MVLGNLKQAIAEGFRTLSRFGWSGCAEPPNEAGQNREKNQSRRKIFDSKT